MPKRTPVVKEGEALLPHERGENDYSTAAVSEKTNFVGHCNTNPAVDTSKVETTKDKKVEKSTVETKGVNSTV